MNIQGCKWESEDEALPAVPPSGGYLTTLSKNDAHPWTTPKKTSRMKCVFMQLEQQQDPFV